MDTDTYWNNLVDRVHRDHEVLSGAEDTYWRLSCIFGETMVDGIEAYFDRRWAEFEVDMAVLRAQGHGLIADIFQEAKVVIFGRSPLIAETVRKQITKLLQEDEEDRNTLAKIGEIYTKLIPQLEDMSAHTHRFGLEHKLYEK